MLLFPLKLANFFTSKISKMTRICLRFRVRSSERNLRSFPSERVGRGGSRCSPSRGFLGTAPTERRPEADPEHTGGGGITCPICPGNVSGSRLSSPAAAAKTQLRGGSDTHVVVAALIKYLKIACDILK